MAIKQYHNKYNAYSYTIEQADSKNITTSVSSLFTVKQGEVLDEFKIKFNLAGTYGGEGYTDTDGNWHAYPTSNQIEITVYYNSSEVNVGIISMDMDDVKQYNEFTTPMLFCDTGEDIEIRARVVGTPTLQSVNLWGDFVFETVNHSTNTIV